MIPFDYSYLYDQASNEFNFSFEFESEYGLHMNYICMDQADRELPNILSLSGISMTDYKSPEAKAAEKFLAKVHPVNGCSDNHYDEIPRIFIGLSKWPTSTNLRCWQCDFAFCGRPKFIPMNPRKLDDGKTEFGVYGNMCTFNCAELWIITNLRRDKMWSAQENLRIVCEIFTGIRTEKIIPAPSKVVLSQYGGTMDNATFRKEIDKIDPESPHRKNSSRRNQIIESVGLDTADSSGPRVIEYDETVKRPTIWTLQKADKNSELIDMICDMMSH